MVIAGIMTSIDELVIPLLNPEQRVQYDKLMSLERLHRRAIDADVIFTWEEARKRGWLSQHDYKIFDELKGLDPLEYFSGDKKD